MDALEFASVEGDSKDTFPRHKRNLESLKQFPFSKLVLRASCFGFLVTHCFCAYFNLFQSLWISDNSMTECVPFAASWLQASHLVPNSSLWSSRCWLFLGSCWQTWRLASSLDSWFGYAKIMAPNSRSHGPRPEWLLLTRRAHHPGNSPTWSPPSPPSKEISDGWHCKRHLPAWDFLATYCQSFTRSLRAMTEMRWPCRWLPGIPGSS